MTTIENIFERYFEFRVGKKKKKDVLQFERFAEDNLFALYDELKSRTYFPGSYKGFYVRDPKLRLIHKAIVVDRVVHHIVSKELEKIFEPTFYAHSYAGRKGKGTHKAVTTLHKMAWKVSRNNTRACWALKCDIRKFFASINHIILLSILKKKIADQDFLDLLEKIINSFYSEQTNDLTNKKGIPIGNLTSQFFSNIYLNELDQFIKHELKVKYYIRYADDFVLLSENKEYLQNLIEPINTFLAEHLDLKLHSNKIILRPFRSGADFLGYIVFPHYILPRIKTKKRLMRRLRKKVKEYKDRKISWQALNQTIQSYLGYLQHANTYRLQKELKNHIWFWLTE